MVRLLRLPWCLVVQLRVELLQEKGESVAKIANDPLGERAEDTLDDNGRRPCYVCPTMDTGGRDTATDQ